MTQNSKNTAALLAVLVASGQKRIGPHLAADVEALAAQVIGAGQKNQEKLDKTVGPHTSASHVGPPNPIHVRRALKPRTTTTVHGRG